MESRVKAGKEFLPYNSKAYFIIINSNGNKKQ